MLLGLQVRAIGLVHLRMYKWTACLTTPTHERRMSRSLALTTQPRQPSKSRKPCSVLSSLCRGVQGAIKRTIYSSMKQKGDHCPVVMALKATSKALCGPERELKKAPNRSPFRCNLLRRWSTIMGSVHLAPPAPIAKRPSQSEESVYCSSNSHLLVAYIPQRQVILSHPAILSTTTLQPESEIGPQ